MATDIKIKDTKTEGVKSINFDAWGGLDGFLAATSPNGGGTTAQQLRRVVPWLAKATDMTASAVSNLPFYIYRGKEVFDSSADWQNKIGGVRNPDNLFYLLASSLCMGRAYLIPQVAGKVIASLQYCSPTSVTPRIDREGLQWFDRTTEHGKTERFYPMPKGNPPMMYFWLPDPDVEIGPAMTYPAGDALLSASLLFSMDDTIKTYSERGFVPATLLSVKGMPAAGEREKAETWWNRFLRGWTKEAAKILNAELMDVKQVGAGMEQLKGSYSQLTKQAIENIGTSFGIPSGLFMADMSFATEIKHLVKLWYSTSAFVKIYRTIEQTFNDQLLSRWGLELKFAPDEIDAFQEEEVERANSFKVYVDAGFKRSWAAQMIGMEMPEGVTYDMLDVYAEEQADKAFERTQQTKETEEEAKNPVDEKEPIPEKKDEDEEKPRKAVTITADQVKDLNLWRQIAERNFKKGKGAAADFECKALDEQTAGIIRLRLQAAKTLEDVTGAFEVQPAEKSYMKDMDVERMIQMLELNLRVIEETKPVEPA